jgi:flagellar biogenesis protein FliO
MKLSAILLLVLVGIIVWSTMRMSRRRDDARRDRKRDDDRTDSGD